MRPLLKLFFALALPVLVWAVSSARDQRAGVSPVSSGPPSAPAGYRCFLENTCPPCQGKPVSRSRKKERRGKCACHEVTYHCEDGSTRTCWDNCE